jgi:light-regulated signal transduction histidine kinase (bacteriophytochrome)
VPDSAPRSPDALQARIHALEAELEALRRTQSVLALGLSHDLRAPLRTVESFSYLLEQRGASLDEQARDHLRRIREASVRMTHLHARLQTWLQAATASLSHKDVDLSLLADWCAAELRDAAPERDATIDIAPGLRVTGDERLLKTALQELLHNAFVFTAPGAPVRIRVDAERTPEGLSLRVHDAGTGFDAANATKLGEPFQRLHADENAERCGFGLAIARVVAERHGGRLHVESTPGQGTIAGMLLPDPP